MKNARPYLYKQRSRQITARRLKCKRKYPTLSSSECKLIFHDPEYISFIYTVNTPKSGYWPLSWLFRKWGK